MSSYSCTIVLELLHLPYSYLLGCSMHAHLPGEIEGVFLCVCARMP